MCAGPELMMAGNLFQGVASASHGMVQSAQAKADAAAEMDAARQQAGLILKSAERRRGAARAATAASGAAIDEFSLGVEQDVLQAGEMDAAMTILGGKRRANVIRETGRQQRTAGFMDAGGSIFKAAYGGWRGTKEPAKLGGGPGYIPQAGE
ncbi:MAG: hypothetical protein ACKVQR_17610 [Aquabacterium sp.]